MPKVSVITPIYQTEQYLERCLDSLVKQTLQDIELIWVDNGASDECRQIMEKYALGRPFIKIIHLEKNIGYGGAMNKGLEIASGEYVGFCDSDDFVDADYYEKLYLKAKETNSDIVYTCYKEENGAYDKNVFHRVSAPLITDEVQKIRALLNGAIWDKIFKRELICDNFIHFPLFNHSYSLDNAFLLLAVLFSKQIALLNTPYYHYVQHQESVMHKEISIFERAEKVKQLIGFILSKIHNKDLSYQTKYELMAFFARSLGLTKLIERDEVAVSLSQVFNSDEEFGNIFEQYSKAVKPSFSQKLFSIQNCFTIKVFWILGFKIKQRKGIF